MDDEKRDTSDIYLSSYCGYACEACEQRDRCVLYGLERFGRKLSMPKGDDEESYRRVATDVGRFLDRMIEAVRAGRIGVPAEGGPEPAARTSRDSGPESHTVLQLSREFTDRAYELLRMIRERETIPVEVLLSLRELQWHHTLVTTNLCRAVACLSREREDKGEESRAPAREAGRSLERCRSALLAIGSVLPESRRTVSDLLELSSKIEEEIRLHFS